MQIEETMIKMIRLMRSYNPDLPMAPGMKAQFLELRDRFEQQEREGLAVVKRHDAGKVGAITVEVGFRSGKASELVQFISDAVENDQMTVNCAIALEQHLESLDIGEVSPDANVELNRKMLLDRSKVGLQKYGVTTERTDLTPAQWAQHAIEEALDFANYLQALKKVLEGQE